MKEYNPTRGVPSFCYYLEVTTSFGDFEVPHETKITHISRNKKELVDLCRENNWPCPDVGNDASGWYTHEIKFKWL